jgi:hypothetical protein
LEKSVRVFLNQALKQLASERSRLDRQISAISTALNELGEKIVAPRARTRRRRTMTAAQKKAVGIRMKAYWAKRRTAKGK